MGIQIKGSNDTISAADGSMVLEGSALVFDNENITGISTMGTGHITGTATIDDDLKVGISTLFVDKSTGRTGIGTVNPNKILTVRGSSTPEILLKPYDASPAIYVGDTITISYPVYAKLKIETGVRNFHIRIDEFAGAKYYFLVGVREMNLFISLCLLCTNTFYLYS